jgi:hypothetical protein
VEYFGPLNLNERTPEIRWGHSCLHRQSSDEQY